ncbi:hypothetical protein TNCV_4912001 [Trichonephila clavipes]|nr:hypothetical protein TNCV_4912001 [Trichonephila clavipes]
MSKHSRYLKSLEIINNIDEGCSKFSEEELSESEVNSMEQYNDSSDTTDKCESSGKESEGENILNMRRGQKRKTLLEFRRGFFGGGRKRKREGDHEDCGIRTGEIRERSESRSAIEKRYEVRELRRSWNGRNCVRESIWRSVPLKHCDSFTLVREVRRIWSQRTLPVLGVELPRVNPFYLS